MQMDSGSGRLFIPGLYNARDLGAMTNADGKALACHRLIRSDALDHLDKDSIDLLASYPVSVIIDLRSEEEAKNHPDTVCGDPRFSCYNIPLLRVNADDINAGIISDTIKTSLGHLYIWMFENSRPYFAEVLRTILREKEKTVLFHCAHGKDRTGLIAAIFYLLCDVEREKIIENYAVSYTYVEKLVAPLIAATPENVHHIYRSDESNMELLLSHLDEKYDGRIGNYLSSCGLSEKEISDLRSILLL